MIQFIDYNLYAFYITEKINISKSPEEWRAVGIGWGDVRGCVRRDVGGGGGNVGCRGNHRGQTVVVAGHDLGARGGDEAGGGGIGEGCGGGEQGRGGGAHTG